MNVLELLGELEDIIKTASGVPLSNKVMVDGNEVLDIIDDIKRSLPDDVRQARWLKGEQDRILSEAKEEYKKLIYEAKKQADFLVDNNDIMLKAKKHADAINAAADDYAKTIKMRTYDYLDRILYDMQGRMEEMNQRYFLEMYNQLANTFEEVNGVLEKNRDEIRSMAYRTQNGEDWMYEDRARKFAED